MQQQLISKLHRKIKQLKMEHLEAQVRLLNTAASSCASNLRDDQNGGAGSLRLPSNVVLLARVFAREATKYATLWTMLHSLYSPADLFGTIPPSTWTWKDHEMRYLNAQNMKLGLTLEFFFILPEALHKYVLKAENPFMEKVSVLNFIPTMSNTCLSCVVYQGLRQHSRHHYQPLRAGCADRAH